MADVKGEDLKHGSLRLEFHGAKVTSDAGLFACIWMRRWVINVK